MTETKSQTAYRRIRNMIIDGTLHENKLYSENQLSELLCMSRTPIRDAIRMLEAERVIEVFRGIGIRLRAITSKEIYELYPLRFMLESYAMQESIISISSAQYDFYIEQWEKLKDRISKGEAVRTVEMRELDRLTHMLFVENSGNETLRELIDQLELKIDRFRSLMSDITDDDLSTADQHIAILRKMKEGHLKDAVSLMEQHLYRPWKTQFDQEGFLEKRLPHVPSEIPEYLGKE